MNIILLVFLYLTPFNCNYDDGWYDQYMYDYYDYDNIVFFA